MISIFCTLEQYKDDQVTKSNLTATMNSTSFPHLFRLSESIFCVYGPPTSSNPVGFCHLTVSETELECSSSDCKWYGSVMRQKKKEKVCIHCSYPLMFLWFGNYDPIAVCIWSKNFKHCHFSIWCTCQLHLYCGTSSSNWCSRYKYFKGIHYWG